MKPMFRRTKQEVREDKKSPGRKRNTGYGARQQWRGPTFPGSTSSCCLRGRGLMRAAAVRNSARMDGDLRGGIGEGQSGWLSSFFRDDAGLRKRGPGWTRVQMILARDYKSGRSFKSLQKPANPGPASEGKPEPARGE